MMAAPRRPTNIFSTKGPPTLAMVIGLVLYGSMLATANQMKTSRTMPKQARLETLDDVDILPRWVRKGEPQGLYNVNGAQMCKLQCRLISFSLLYDVQGKQCTLNYPNPLKSV